MLQLSPKSYCDTYLRVSTSMPILTGLEFFCRPAKLQAIQQLEYELVCRMAKVRHWNFDLHRFREFIQNPLHASIITNTQQQIEWVNQGFIAMTGYQIQESLGEKPSFLQGIATDSTTKSVIRSRLLKEERFEGRLINYRKNGSSYWCEVCIEPIFNQKQQLVNFIAFEKELR